ncbi:unnamed protein product, partial [marine sediment metagenome]
NNPRLFNFHFKRVGGRLGYSTCNATFREDELKELEKLIQTSLLNWTPATKENNE